jgi:uracil-DNA glycosylase family protein
MYRPAPVGYPLDVGAEDYLPPDEGDLDELRKASAGCQGCDLYENATQTVFGDGSPDARLLLVGEQPGDREDVAGEPFVGPAGHLLDRALTDAGIDRRLVWLTNAVKHFKWEARGPRRLHKTPSARERAACRPWLMAEIMAVRPDVIVCMGATASQSVFGSGFRLTAHRGELLDGPAGASVVVTIHPSAVLRMKGDDREKAYAGFVEDLRRAAGAAGAG